MTQLQFDFALAAKARLTDIDALNEFSI